MVKLFITLGQMLFTRLKSKESCISIEQLANYTAIKYYSKTSIK